jgi:hypothetical protein
MTMPTLKLLVLNVLNDYPDLGLYGFDHSDLQGHAATRSTEISDGMAHDVATAIEYIVQVGIQPTTGSYGLKHFIESWAKAMGRAEYIPNGVAIIAAVLCGYVPVRETKDGPLDSPNCLFKKTTHAANRKTRKAPTPA